MPSPDGTHQAGYGEHPMGTSHVLSPRWGPGDIARGTVRSGGGRWSVLTWLQAKWAKSPEASDPWKEKWGEVAGGDSRGQRSRSIPLAPSPWDRSVPRGRAQGRVTNVPASIWVPHPFPFCLARPPPCRAARGWSRNVYG